MVRTSIGKRAIGYVRCSTLAQVQDGETLERQEALIRAYCVQKGIADVEIFADEGMSGFKTARPAFQRLVKMCNAGQVTMVVVTDLSRLSRSVRDTLQFVDDVVQKRGVQLVSLTQDLDTSTPMGKAFLAMTSVFNELYRNEISFKTKVAIQFKKAKGERYSGSVPYGFTDNGDGKLVASASDRNLIALVHALRTKRLSLRDIARELEARGVLTKTGKTAWNVKTISSLLKMALLAGVVTNAVTDRRASSGDGDTQDQGLAAVAVGRVI